MNDMASDHRSVPTRLRAAIESRVERLKAVLVLADRQSDAIRRKHFGGLDRILTERAAIVDSLVADTAAFEALARAQEIAEAKVDVTVMNGRVVYDRSTDHG